MPEPQGRARNFHLQHTRGDAIKRVWENLSWREFDHRVFPFLYTLDENNQHFTTENVGREVAETDTWEDYEEQKHCN